MYQVQIAPFRFTLQTQELRAADWETKQQIHQTSSEQVCWLTLLSIYPWVTVTKRTYPKLADPGQDHEIYSTT